MNKIPRILDDALNGHRFMTSVLALTSPSVPCILYQMMGERMENLSFLECLVLTGGKIVVWCSSSLWKLLLKLLEDYSGRVHLVKWEGGMNENLGMQAVRGGLNQPWVGMVG